MPPTRPPLCPGRVYDGAFYACGRAVLYRDPHKRQEDGCPSGLFVCTSCADGFVEFLDAARDVKARHKEWEVN